MSGYQIAVIVLLVISIGENLYKWLDKKQTIGALLGGLFVQVLWVWLLYNCGCFK